MLLIILIILFLLLLIPTAVAGVIGAPLAITSKKQLKEIIEKMEIKKGDRFYELGSGTGRVMKQAGKTTKVIGFELSPIYYLISFLNLKLNKIKFKLYLKDFFRASLKEADIVFFFLMPTPIERLKIKLEKELKKETKVISFCFPVKGWTPYLIIKKEKQLPVYFYRR